MKKYIILGVIAVVVIAIFISGRNSYNSMITLDQEVEQAWAKVEVQYQRRMDLIPNMVEVVKGYAEHESNTFENVTKARAGLSDAYNEARSLEDGATPSNAQAFEDYTAAQNRLKSALSLYVNAVHEAYPELKANEQFNNLQTVLEGTENRIATERGRYTDVVKEYNVSVRRFPANIWASIFDFQTKPQFKADEAAASAPKVSF